MTVRLEQHGERLHVAVVDDGRGFEAARVFEREDGGVGLHIMRERAEGLGGSLTIDSQPGRGTVVAASVPLTN